MLQHLVRAEICSERNTIMRYTSPKLVQTLNANLAIMGQQKGSIFVVDSLDPTHARTATQGAYEADE